LIQAGFRGNLAFIGLPLVIFTTHDFPEAEQLKLESAVLIALPPVVIFYNIASVTALSIYSTSTEQLLSWRKVLFNISTNPLLIACLAGLVVQRTGLGIPTALSRTCEVIGASAFSIALIGIGSQLASISVAGKWTESLTSSVIKNVACPIAGWIIGVSIGLSGTELLVILIMCATPTAVSSFILADQIGGDANQAASTVVVGTACSFATLSVLLMLPF
jgi:predicted permease